jgi:hypothetical protein
LAAAQARAAAAAAVRFPGEDGGQSLVAMAQRDLDAALQLLADRAQYITGASGAAIAIRRNGRDDMLCRASVGTNAPELGALLSTEFGLSGESVRTRQLLRCDDAERDVRVNRDVCRQMGIASVLVMPVVNDDQVLGVFELFSGKTNAFGERDLSAVQRLSEMVETAVRLAQAAENLPEHLTDRDNAVSDTVHPAVFEAQFLSDLAVNEVKQDSEEEPVDSITTAAVESDVLDPIPPAVDEALKSLEPTKSEPVPQVQAAPVPVPVPAPEPVKKPVFWSAAAVSEGETPAGTEPDQSHVPPMLRGLRKCEACGFPISAGRVLCVECEEKKWRGQLRPQLAARKPPTPVATIPASKPAGSSFTAAAPSMAKDPVSQMERTGEAAPKLAVVPPGTAPGGLQPSEASNAPAETAALPEVAPAATGAPEFVLSSGIEPSQSWFSANRYIVVVLVVIGIVGAAFLLLR